MTTSAKKAVKNIISSIGVEVMSRKGLQNIEQGHRSTIDEYVRLLAETRSVILPENADRVPLLTRLVGTEVGEAAHLITCLNEVLDLPGDVCECGVGSGATSALLANEMRLSGKCLWLYDTFAGLPAPTIEDRLIDDIESLGSMAAYEGRMCHSEIEVRGRMNAIRIPNKAYRLIPGLFEKSVAADYLPAQVCFAYVDFDFYAPIKLALEALSARLSPGGIIIVDDYGFFSEGAQKAVDEFMAANSQRVDVQIPAYCHDRFAILRHRL